MARSHRTALPFLSLLTFGFLLALLVFLGVALRDEMDRVRRARSEAPREAATIASVTTLAPPEPTKPAPRETPVPAHRARVKGVVLASGAPVAGASVLAVADLRSETVTDARGRFELVLDPGRWIVIARGPGGHATGASLALDEGTDERIELSLLRPLAISGTVHDQSGGPLVARIELTGPDVHRLANSDPDGSYSFADLSPGTYSLTAWVGGLAKKRFDAILLEDAPVKLADVALGPGGSVRGTVRDANRAPVGNASVWAIKSRECVGEVRTPPNGEFLLEDLPAGPLELVAFVEAPSNASGRIHVDVATGGETRADVVLRDWGSLRGEVRFADGRALGRGKVVARSAETGRSWSAHVARGDFLLDAPPGPFQFTVESGEGAIPFLDLPWSEIDQRDRAHGHVIELPQEGAIQGVLKDEKGESLVVARAGIYQAGSKASREGFVDTTGGFAWSPLPPGEYTFVARGWDNTAQLWDGRFYEAEVLVHAGETVSLTPTLGPAARVEGVLVDATGERLRGVDVSVSLRSGLQKFAVQTDDAGAFTTAIWPAKTTFWLTKGALELSEKKAGHGLVFTPVRLQLPSPSPIVLVADGTD